MEQRICSATNAKSMTVVAKQNTNATAVFTLRAQYFSRDVKSIAVNSALTKTRMRDIIKMS